MNKYASIYLQKLADLMNDEFSSAHMDWLHHEGLTPSQKKYLFQVADNVSKQRLKAFKLLGSNEDNDLYLGSSPNYRDAVLYKFYEKYPDSINSIIPGGYISIMPGKNEQSINSQSLLVNDSSTETNAINKILEKRLKDYESKGLLNRIFSRKPNYERTLKTLTPDERGFVEKEIFKAPLDTFSVINPSLNKQEVKKVLKEMIREAGGRSGKNKFY